MLYLCLTLYMASVMALSYAEQTNPHAIMKVNAATIQQWMEAHKANTRTPSQISALTPPPDHYDLLSHLNYDPNERDQGYCGNCWAWASTGVLEVALDVQRKAHDRLSVQYLNSFYDGSVASWAEPGNGPGYGPDWACCGSDLDPFATFYNSKKIVVPWSNTNAGWYWYPYGVGVGDYYSRCNYPNGRTKVPGSSVSTKQKYPFTSISSWWISTIGVDQAQAITNIKNVLLDNKAVYFAFSLADDNDWNEFYGFWDTQPESAIWNPDPYSGHTWVYGEGGGHAVLLLGYDTTDTTPRIGTGLFLTVGALREVDPTGSST